MPSLLQQKFYKLPQPLIDWLTSDSVTDIIIRINQRFDLVGNSISILPKLIEQLVTKEIAPENFISALKEKLFLDDKQAFEIAAEINAGILKLIENELKKVGVYGELIFTVKSKVSQPSSTQSQIPPITSIPTQQPGFPRPVYPIYTPVKPASPLPPTRFTSPVMPAQPIAATPAPIKKIETMADEVKPFLLHEENPTILPQVTPPLARPITPTFQDKSLKPSFSYMPPKPPTLKIPQRQISKPPQVKIEGVKTKNFLQETKEPKIKLVHYSQFKTTL